MTLIQIMDQLGSLSNDATIYAEEPWTEGSAAIVEVEPDDGGLPDEAKAGGLTYFIEVAIAREFLEGWAGNLRSEPTLEEKCDRLVRYAVFDA